MDSRSILLGTNSESQEVPKGLIEVDPETITTPPCILFGLTCADAAISFVFL